MEAYTNRDQPPSRCVSFKDGGGYLSLRVTAMRGGARAGARVAVAIV